MNDDANGPRSWARRNLPPLGLIVGCVLAMYVCSAPLRQATKAAYEGKAVNTARKIASAELTIEATRGRLAELAELTESGMITADDLGHGAQGGYAFRVDLDPDGKRFLVHALPPTGWTKYRFFSVDELGRLRTSLSGEADRRVSVEPVP